MSITPVILCGGSGTRLWPVSTPELPKQFHSFTGGASLLQETAQRSRTLGLGPPVVVCSRADLDTVRLQLEAIEVEPARMITEPQGRNTAPAIAAAAALHPGLMLVIPADHVIADLPAFRHALGVGVSATEEGMMVVFGVVPTRPETGYGYIKPGNSGAAWHQVLEFTEKPDASTSARMVEEGYLWNSGMFLFESTVVLDEMGKWAPRVLETVSRSLPGTQGLVTELTDEFLEAPVIAFDRAVMEKTDRAAVVPLDAGWSDVGSWNALWELLEKDESGNVAQGDVLLVDVTRSYVRASRRVVVLGLSDVVVVDTGDTVLVTSRAASQRVGELG